MNAVGRRIRQKRKELKISQNELGEILGWTDAQKRISNYESGSREPSIDLMIRIANALGCSPSWLTYGELDEVVANKMAGRVEALIGEGPGKGYSIRLKHKEETIIAKFTTEEFAKLMNGKPANGLI